MRLFALLLLALAAPAAAQNDCGPNLRCGQVPWQLPAMPILVSPTPFATSAVVNYPPTQPSAPIAPTATPGGPIGTVVMVVQPAQYYLPTPIFCENAPPVLDTNYKQIVANSGPSAYWPLDETAGTAVTDATGSGLTGTYTGATLNGYTVAGGAAPSFDGVNDRAFITGLNGLMNSQQFTVSLWFRVASSWAGSGTLLYFGDSEIFSLTRSGGSVVLTSGARTASASASAAGTNWVHVAAVISRPIMGGLSGRLYLNGTGAADVNTAPWTFASADTLFIGSNGLGSYFAGGLAHVALYNRALTASEISVLANNAPSAVYTPTPDPNCRPAQDPIGMFDISGVTNMMSTLQTIPMGEVEITNPQAGVDMYTGTASFFGYVLGIQNINLGIFTPILLFMFWSFFTFVGIKIAGLLLPIVAALVGAIRRVIQLVLDFLPF